MSVLTTAELTHYSRKASQRVESLSYEVKKERWRQIRKWGPQSWPSGTGDARSLMGTTFTQYAVALKAWNDEQAKPGGAPTWAPILLEEIFEAMESTDFDRVREELVQSMAVIAAWIEDIDERKAR